MTAYRFPERIVDVPGLGKLKAWATSATHVGLSTEPAHYEKDCQDRVTVSHEGIALLREADIAHYETEVARARKEVDDLETQLVEANGRLAAALDGLVAAKHAHAKGGDR